MRRLQRRVKLCCSICLGGVLLYLVYFHKRSAFLPQREIYGLRDVHNEPTYRPTYIPRIIHFIWNNETIPNEFHENVRGFTKNNPASRWEYYFWTKTSGLKFIKDKYVDVYTRNSDKLGSLDVMRADVLRYLVVHEYGGFYFDLDTVSVKPLDDYAASHQCSLALEPGEHYFHFKTDILITNSALMCTPRHPFYKRIISKIAQLKATCKSAFKCTGPHLISNMFREGNKTFESRSQLPDLEPSELFQDKYDSNFNEGRLQSNCFGKTTLQPYQIAICENWKARGMSNRNLSSKALTYHTGYHTHYYNITFSRDITIYDIIPSVKIYGHNLYP